DGATVTGPAVPGATYEEVAGTTHDTRCALVWKALCVALKDYVNKNGFDKVWLGLSGGIDSAVVAAIASDALGGHKLHTVTMPGPYSSPVSAELAAESARLCGAASFTTAPIGGMFDRTLGVLDSSVFMTGEPGVAEENLQARL